MSLWGLRPLESTQAKLWGEVQFQEWPLEGHTSFPPACPQLHPLQGVRGREGGTWCSHTWPCTAQVDSNTSLSLHPILQMGRSRDWDTLNPLSQGSQIKTQHLQLGSGGCWLVKLVLRVCSAIRK